MRTRNIFVIALLFALYTVVCAASGGTIKGRIVDAETKAPLSGASIMVLGTDIGAASDMDGYFRIPNVPSGSYSVRGSYIGYKEQIKTEVIVRSTRETEIYYELRAQVLQTNDVVVTSGYFESGDPLEINNHNYSYEEVRRAPGSAGDISRILFALPSVAKVDDQKNSLIVRGGNPIENGFIIDDIEVPNINHFPSQGSTGGAVGLINVDLLRDVSFSPGGFSAVYGDKLSSIVNMSFREGSRNRIEGQLDFSLMGIGGVLEGPLSEKGSWMLSVRQSYIEQLIKIVDVGSSIAPKYGDYQFKAVYDLSPDQTLSLLSIGGYDQLSTDNQVAEENKMTAFAHQNIYEQTTGISLKSFWSKNAYSITSVAFTTDFYKEDYFETTTQNLLFKNRSSERTLKLRNNNFLKLTDIFSVDFGIDAKLFRHSYDNFYGQRTLQNGSIKPASSLVKDVREYMAGGYINVTVRPIPNVTLTLGGRGDYFSATENSVFSPRASMVYEFSDITSLTFSTGIYYQNLPLLLLAQRSSANQLREMRAEHYGLSFSHLLSSDTRLTLEVYQKNYSRFPMNPATPTQFMLDEMQAGANFLGDYSDLKSNGKARTWGVEFMIQKKLAKDFYGVVSGTYFRSTYTDMLGNERDRTFDNQYILNISGGYKLDDSWEFSARWVIAGGIPYTPFDANLSTIAGMGISRDEDVNSKRYSPYHSLNIRADKRFSFGSSNLVVFVSVWNAYNNQNVAQYYWNQKDNKEGTIYQWGLLPIIGLEYEF